MRETPPPTVRLHRGLGLSVTIAIILGCAGVVPTAPPDPSYEGGVLQAAEQAARRALQTGKATPEPPPAPAPADRLAASWVVIGWTGTTPAPRVPRTEEQARGLAVQVRNDLQHGADVAALARRLSDDPTGPRGGALGIFRSGTLDPQLELALQTTAPGQPTDVLKTPRGFVVLLRQPVVEARVRWYLFGWQGARGSRSTASRTDARARAEVAADALRHHETVTGAELMHDGDAEQLGRLQWPPDADAAVFALAPGSVSAPIETPQGWLVVERLADP